MIINQDYDLSKPLATAIRAKAPFVAIPLPGFAPLTFKRDKLAAALHGVKPLDVRVIASNDGAARWLVVEGVASEGRVRTCCKMIATPAAFWKTRQGREELAKWKDASRPTKAIADAAVARKAKPKNFALAVSMLKRLERELADMRNEYTLRNPCLIGSKYQSEYRQHEVEQWQDYRQTRRMRTMVGALARRMHNEPSRKLYDAMRGRGWQFVSYSEVRQPDREKYASNYWAYLGNLWRFVRGTGPQAMIGMRRYAAMRASESPVPVEADDVPVWGPVRYGLKLEDMRQRQSVREQIASVVSECPAAAIQVKVERLQRDLKAKWYRRREGVQAELEAAKAELEAALTVKQSVAGLETGEVAHAS